ncbi:MAG: hypothetical protein HC877_00600 [Thioploca sp.]|nr:hypothetical protein [Thioploca sp.]
MRYCWVIPEKWLANGVSHGQIFYLDPTTPLNLPKIANTCYLGSVTGCEH